MNVELLQRVAKKLTSKACRVIGHRPGRRITGFRNIDAAAIMRCRFCNVPIVSRRLEASAEIMMDLYGQAALDAAIRFADAHDGELRKDKGYTWEEYTWDSF